MNSSFPNRWSFSYLKFTKYVTNIIAEPKCKYGQQEQVTVRNHNRSTVWNGQYKNTRGLKLVLRVPNLALSFYHGSKHKVVRSAWRFSNSSTDHQGKRINHRLILWWNKDEDWTKTCCDRHLEIPGVSNNTTGTLEQKKPTVEPRWAKQQTKKLWSQPTKINSFISGPSLSLTPDPPACN